MISCTSWWPTEIAVTFTLSLKPCFNKHYLVFAGTLMKNPTRWQSWKFGIRLQRIVSLFLKILSLLILTVTSLCQLKPVQSIQPPRYIKWVSLRPSVCSHISLAVFIWQTFNTLGCQLCTAFTHYLFSYTSFLRWCTVWYLD